MRTCYDILGCTPSASTSELKSAYFQSLRANHPDKGGLDASAISLIANAWKILRPCGGPIGKEDMQILRPCERTFGKEDMHILRPFGGPMGAFYMLHINVC
ncbi:unnamed protein product [Toxocara canis]|uniref:J domain-containing protein n=1 Tax=Toxocara canis TaxID=6265 RepID=A0A183U3C8_TOXCA|nr:unnamed protein product [Toxocara canis]